MSQSAVERALGKMITDPFFRHRFFEDPAGTSASAGLDLSQGELRALVRLPSAAFSRFSLFLDERIARRAYDEQPAAEVLSH